MQRSVHQGRHAGSAAITLGHRVVDPAAYDTKNASACWGLLTLKKELIHPLDKNLLSLITSYENK